MLFYATVFCTTVRNKTIIKLLESDDIFVIPRAVPFLVYFPVQMVTAQASFTFWILGWFVDSDLICNEKSKLRCSFNFSH